MDVMSDLSDDIDELEEAMRLFLQFVKRPQHWARIMSNAGVQLDRPSTIILHSLLEKPCRVQDLATLLGVESPSITRKTQELEAMGLLKRLPNRQDRRAIDLRITPRGKALVNRIWKAQRLPMNQVLESWPTQDRQKFTSLFLRFSQDLATLNYPPSKLSTTKQKGLQN